MRGCGPSALGELQVELALVSRDPDAARGQLVEVLGLPVQEAVLLEVLHGARDLLEREPESLRQGVTRVQVGRVRRRVVDLAVLEQDSSLQVHRHSPGATSPQRARGGTIHRARKMATAWPRRAGGGGARTPSVGERPGYNLITCGASQPCKALRVSTTSGASRTTC